MALKPRRGTWAYGPDAHTPVDAARALAWGGPDDPGDWHTVTRTFRDGHAETWHAADATLGWWGPDGTRRLVVATADPAALPAKATWYLATNLPRPGGPREDGSPHPAADLAEVVRIYGIRHWTGRVTSRSRTSWAGPTSRSAPIPRSAAIRCWSPARSASAGTPGSTTAPQCTNLQHRGRKLSAESGGPRAAVPPAPSWPRALRAVRAWLSPWIALQRWWQAWSRRPPPPPLQALINSVGAGCGLHLYIPN